MTSLEELRSQLSEIGSPQMQADGYALWLSWLGDLNPTVIQTLEDYGGIQVAADTGQSLWFYFSTDILLAAARIGVWARFNPLAVTMQVFPSRMRVDNGGRKGMIFDESIWQQSFEVPTDFRMLVHSGMSQAITLSPGLSLEEPAPQKGLSAVWSGLVVDTRLPYQSTLGWYALLRPVGNPLDKAYQVGWREFFAQVEAVLQRNKFRFTVQDSFVMFPLDTLRQYKAWCRDFLSLIQRLKSEAPAQYWPCVTVVVERKGLPLNEELPKKLNVEWEQLTPDFPHMSMRNALMLGDEFALHEVRFAPSRQSPDDWCSLSLQEVNAAKTGALPQMSPTNLVVGNYPHCFYCGQRSHLTTACPSRHMDDHDPQVWPAVGRMTFTDMRQAVHAIDEQLDAALGEEKDAAIIALSRDPSPGGLLLRAFFDIDWAVQLRSLSFFWRARTKDFHKAASELSQRDNNPVWDHLATFASKDPHESEKELSKLAVRFPKDFRLMSLRGFAAMELGDVSKALAFWKEAEVYSPFPVMQAWHIFLQARLLEFAGRFPQAMDLYDQVTRTCPSWHDALYRRLVCEVKSGFSERALAGLSALIDKNGHYFNRALIDPEMDRGHIQVFDCLYTLWTTMESRIKEEDNNLRRISAELTAWFTPGHTFAGELQERINKLMQLSSIANYVPWQQVSSGRLQLERDLQMFVAQEGKSLRARFKTYAESLRTIHAEAAWFPFPGALVEFNRSYNQGVSNMNWALMASLQSPEAFKKALAMADEEEQRIEKLENRMKFLRIVRDATLFLLSMAESFFWLELVGIVAVFVILPLLLIYGDKIGLSWTAEAIARERWQVQKALLLVVTILALGIAGLRTLVRFDRIREKIFAKAKAGALTKKVQKSQKTKK